MVVRLVQIEIVKTELSGSGRRFNVSVSVEHFPTFHSLKTSDDSSHPDRQGAPWMLQPLLPLSKQFMQQQQQFFILDHITAVRCNGSCSKLTPPLRHTDIIRPSHQALLHGPPSPPPPTLTLLKTKPQAGTFTDPRKRTKRTLAPLLLNAGSQSCDFLKIIQSNAN